MSVSVKARPVRKKQKYTTREAGRCNVLRTRACICDGASRVHVSECMVGVSVCVEFRSKVSEDFEWQVFSPKICGDFCGACGNEKSRGPEGDRRMSGRFELCEHFIEGSCVRVSWVR